MHPIAPRSTRHAALLGLAGISPPRSRALPGAPITAHSGASNCFFQVEPAKIVAGPPSRQATSLGRFRALT